MTFKVDVKLLVDLVGLCLLEPEDAVAELVAQGMTVQGAEDALEEEFDGRPENNA